MSMKMTVMGKFKSGGIKEGNNATVIFGYGIRAVVGWLATELFVKGELVAVLTDCSVSVAGHNVWIEHIGSGDDMQQYVVLSDGYKIVVVMRDKYVGLFVGNEQAEVMW